MLGLDRAQELGARESGLALVVTSRADGSPQASVVNAGVLVHPVISEPVVGFVARGGARKLATLRMQPRVMVVFRSGWEWVALEGDADLAGPNDHLQGLQADDVPRLLREVYAAAVGSTEDQWVELDATMAAERHTAVLFRALHVYSNPAGSQ